MRIPTSLQAALGATALFALTFPASANDWLIDPAPYKAKVFQDQATGDLVLDNGLARRVFRLTPNAATVDLVNLSADEHILRAIAPEARVTVNGAEFEIGGLKGQPIA